MLSSCPARAGDPARPVPICGNRPAGIVSVSIVKNPVAANASSPDNGKRPRTEAGAAAAGGVVVVSVMPSMLTRQD